MNQWSKEMKQELIHSEKEKEKKKRKWMKSRMNLESRGLVRIFVHYEECMEGVVDLSLGYICYNPNKTRKE